MRLSGVWRFVNLADRCPLFPQQTLWRSAPRIAEESVRSNASGSTFLKCRSFAVVGEAGMRSKQRRPRVHLGGLAGSGRQAMSTQRPRWKGGIVSEAAGSQTVVGRRRRRSEMRAREGSRLAGKSGRRGESKGGLPMRGVLGELCSVVPT